MESGGWASDLLRELTAGLDSRDAGLASEIVFGCLRYQAQLDYLIDRHAGSRTLDREVRIALRMGIYQIRHLDRVPAHAAVGESVELVKRAHKRSATGFVNAILRKVDRAPAAWPNRAIEFSCPAWLLDRWDGHYGPATSQGIASAALRPPEMYVASTGRIQDIGSQSIVPLLELRPNMSFLDLCAAPGNKTAQAIQIGAQAVACDLHWHRLNDSGLACPRVVLDGTRPLPFSRRFHRILVDAPCSGTGTLGRNPEIKWQLRLSDLANLHGRQVALLRSALECLVPGGTLVYSTCSLEEEENEHVIAAFLGDWRIHRRIPGIDPGDGFFAAVLTSK